MPVSRIALLDGTVVDSSVPLLRADDLGVLRGDGVFETTLAVDSVPRDLDEHLARMRVSASMVDLDLPAEDGWRRAVAAVLAAGDPRQTSVRLVATRGPESGGPPTAFVTASPLPTTTIAQREGIRVLTLPRGFAGAEAAAAPWLLAGAKTLSYAVNMATQRYAKANDADDVIFVGTDGAVLEAPTATVVVARDRTLATPPGDGILDGITVRRLFASAEQAGYRTVVRPVRPTELGEADGVWLASSVRLLAPVVAIDGTARPIGPQHRELGRLLQVPAS